MSENYDSLNSEETAGMSDVDPDENVEVEDDQADDFELDGSPGEAEADADAEEHEPYPGDATEKQDEEA